MDDISPITDVLMDSDRRHLIHPLHHPKDHANAKLFTRGEGAILHTSDGKQYIDGLSCLWNVNIGHGRKELAAAASAQMEKLACKMRNRQTVDAKKEREWMAKMAM